MPRVLPTSLDARERFCILRISGCGTRSSAFGIRPAELISTTQSTSILSDYARSYPSSKAESRFASSVVPLMPGRVKKWLTLNNQRKKNKKELFFDTYLSKRKKYRCISKNVKSICGLGYNNLG